MSDVTLRFIDINGLISENFVIDKWEILEEDYVAIYVNPENYDARILFNTWFFNPDRKNMLLTFNKCPNLVKICFGCTPYSHKDNCFILHANSTYFSDENNCVNDIRNHFRSHFIKILNKVIDNLNFM